MNLLTLMVESWFDRRNVQKIRQLISLDPEAAEILAPETSAIYRVPPPPSREVELSFDIDEAKYHLRRSLLELFCMGHRIYIIDSDPFALFSKPVAVAVIKGLGQKPAYFAIGKSHVFINEGAFPLFSHDALLETVVDNEHLIGPPELTPDIQATTLGPLTGKFPPEDLDNPKKDDPRPKIDPPPTGTSTSSKTVLLMYGLCFQNYLIPYYSASSGKPDKLWRKTEQVTSAFKSRSYETETSLAGEHDPTQSSKAETFPKMMNGLKKDIEAHTAYCNNENDQLVIYISAHGYSRKDNDTGDVALVYQPKKGVEEFITYRKLLDTLAGIPEIRKAPEKVYLIIFSCRAGRIFEGGVMPTHLKGMHILTSSNSSDQKSYTVNEFVLWIQQALHKKKGARTWEDFVKLVKWYGRKSLCSKGTPRNGDVTGCVATVTLTSVKYGGDDIGVTWRYNLRFDGKTKGNTSRGPCRTIDKHILKHGDTESQNIVVHERIWPKNETVLLDCLITAYNFECNQENPYRETISFKCVCNNTIYKTIKVPVSIIGGGKAALDFEFKIETSS